MSCSLLNMKDSVPYTQTPIWSHAICYRQRWYYGEHQYHHLQWFRLFLFMLFKLNNTITSNIFSNNDIMTLEILFTSRRLSVTEASSNDTGVYTCTGPTVGLFIFGDDMLNNDIGNDIGNNNPPTLARSVRPPLWGRNLPLPYPSPIGGPIQQVAKYTKKT